MDGTIDYARSGQPGSGYHKGHLSIAYGSVAATQFRVSIGADTGINDSLCGECEGTYGVRDNQPDPGTIDVNSGLVKYELMSRNEESRFVKEAVGNISLGTFLVQHLGNRTIRVEVIIFFCTDLSTDLDLLGFVPDNMLIGGLDVDV